MILLAGTIPTGCCRLIVGEMAKFDSVPLGVRD